MCMCFGGVVTPGVCVESGFVCLFLCTCVAVVVVASLICFACSGYFFLRCCFVHHQFYLQSGAWPKLILVERNKRVCFFS